MTEMRGRRARAKGDGCSGWICVWSDMCAELEHMKQKLKSMNADANDETIRACE